MPLSDKDILLQAKKRYDHAYTEWSEFQNKSTTILKIIAGEQWTDLARQNFENAGFSAMTSNRLPTFLRQITNEIRKNPPQIQIDPHSDDDKQHAEMLNDLIRNIQEESNANIAYIKAAEMAASVGIGYFLIRSDYKSNDSFDQEIVIEPIEDVNTVLLDPNHKGLCAQDAEYAFIVNVISKDEYKREYGNTRLGRQFSGTSTEDDIKELQWIPKNEKWVSKDQVLIATYYFKDYKKEMLYQVMNVNGEVHITNKLDKNAVKDGLLTVVQSREVLVPVIRVAKLNDLEILEQSEWPGCYLPLIAVKGDEYWIQNKRKIVGAVEPAIETQVSLNYAMSWRAQLLQMAPKAPYVGTVNQFKTFEQQWQDINRSNQAFIPYNKEDGAPPPQRDTAEAPIQAATILIKSAEEDLNAIFGTFDPSNQVVAPESGKAILARQDQSYNSNYHFYDNLARAIEHAGSVITEAVPVIYDNAREVQLLAQDGKRRTVSINMPNEAGVVEYDMSKKGYTVSIETGPGFGTKRQEMVEAGLALMETVPGCAPAIADIIVRNMDVPGADKMADSMEALAPPQVLAARKVDPKNAAAMVPGLQSQLQAANAHIQQLTAEHQQMAEKLNDKSDNVMIETMKSKVEEKKIDSENAIKMKQLELEEQTTELEYLVREKQLQIEQEELNLKKAQLAIQGVKVAADMNNDAHDHTLAHIDRIAVETPGTGETSLSKNGEQSMHGMKGDLK